MYFRDPDGDALTYRVSSTIPSIAAASVSGNIVTIAGVSRGRVTLTLTARDPAGLTATQTVAVSVVQTANRPPEAVGAIPAQALQPGEEASLDISSYFHDPDGDALTYSALSSDEGVVVATMWRADNRILVFNVPAAIAEGEATVTVAATDPEGLTATQEVSVTVGGNRAPEAVGTIPPQSLAHGTFGQASFSVVPYFHDPDGDKLTYSAESGNAALVSAAMWPYEDGVLVLRSAGAVGSTTVTVTATDPGGLTATQTLSVTVRPPGSR